MCVRHVVDERTTIRSDRSALLWVWPSRSWSLTNPTATTGLRSVTHQSSTAPYLLFYPTEMLRNGPPVSAKPACFARSTNLTSAQAAIRPSSTLNGFRTQILLGCLTRRGF